MSETATATAQNPTEANASTEASATLLAGAGSGTGETQQTQTAQTQTATTAEAPTTETKTTETSAATGAPEKYEFTAPEGKTYDPAVLESFSGAAKEANLTQDVAQKLIDTMVPALAARQADQLQAIHKGWSDAAASDTEFGGDKLKENLSVARKALDTFATPELRKLLEDTGLGSHPEVLRMLYRTGKAISEDKFVGGTGRGAKPDAVSVLYDHKK